MFCSGCGQELAPGQTFCSHCGRPSATVVPPIPGLQFQLQTYAGKIRILSVFWFIYGGLSLMLAFAALAFAHAFFSGSFGPWGHAPWIYGPWSHGPWSHGPMPPNFFPPFLLRFAWAFLAIRAALLLAAGWGLMERTYWGRVVAIIAAILSLIRFPFGTALGIWTLVVLLGYRNAALYEQL